MNTAFLVNLVNKNYNDRMWFYWSIEPDNTDPYFKDAWIFEVDEADCAYLVVVLNSLMYGLNYADLPPFTADNLIIKYPYLFTI